MSIYEWSSLHESPTHPLRNRHRHQITCWVTYLVFFVVFYGEGGRGRKGDNYHPFKAIFHCLVSSQGDECFKMLENTIGFNCHVVLQK